MHCFSSTLIGSLLTIFLCLIIQACHPPIYNQTSQHHENVKSWQGVRLNELIAVKGIPIKLYYLGEFKVTLINSEYWTPELDRFEELYRPFSPPIEVEKNENNYDDLYHLKNSKAQWLFVYKTALNTSRYGYKECTEYYMVDKDGMVLKANYIGTAIGDQRFCYAPRRRNTPI